MKDDIRFVHGGGDDARRVVDEWETRGIDGPLTPYILKMKDGADLDVSETDSAMTAIMNGDDDVSAMAAFLAALGTKGVITSELVAMAKSMRRYASGIEPDTSGFDGLLTDTCGTGGDVSGTFNVSTAAAFVAAAAGIPVAKHGNRSVTSSCGSADVLEALGTEIDLDPDDVCECIETVGIGFLFARRFHSSMRHVAGARAILGEHGLKSVFNLLGPLTNPAGAQAQLLGVFDPSLTEMFGMVLAELGCRRALCVHGSSRDGTVRYDEISIDGPTRITELNDEEKNLKTYEINPADLGIDIPSSICLAGGKTADQGAAILRDVLAGRRRDACRSVLLANAGAAIYAGIPETVSISDGTVRAAEIIDSGAALDKLDSFISMTQRLRK